MAEFVAAVGAIASFVQLAQVLAGLAGNLRQSRHHGQQVTRLRDILEELSHLRLRIGDDHPDVGRLRKLLDRCRTLIEEHDPTFRISRGITFVWPASLDNEIRIINEDLTRMYNRLLLYRVELPPTPSSSGSQQDQGPLRKPTLPPYSLPEPAITPSTSRRGSLNFIDLPTTLCLRDNDPRIALQRVNILERDNWSRILQYESSDKKVVVTHRIPFGTKPTTDDDIRATRVHFLSRHEITVEDQDGFRIYCLDPVYHFSNPGNCKQFIAKVRERELIETFLPRKIEQAVEVRARYKVLRIWRKDEGTNPPLVTMSFLDRNEGRQAEFDLRLYSRDAQSRRRKTVDIWRMDGSTRLSLAFDSSKGDPPEKTPGLTSLPTLVTSFGLGLSQESPCR
ncbi:hypothetical protein SLS53_006271 [Cytospora paraplurivora]|uniref:Uncharacterized protein n=1 Tax=Cytospora paraplurivora TaxID=2898453 RepID=A0AAN9U3E7_9PEZI